MTRRLIISLHDVNPKWDAEVRTCLAMLDDLGVRGVSLLVIPEYRGSAFDADPAFIDYLHGRERAGDEIVLHGWKHIEQIRPQGFVRSLRRAVLTRGEGEFLGLTPEQCAHFLTQAKNALAARGFAPEGFIAPAWLIEKQLYPTLRELGFAYTIRQSGIVPLATGTRIAAPTAVLRGSSYDMNRLSRFVSNVRSGAWYNKPVVRVSIHPVDFRHGAETWYRIFVPALMRKRETTTYLEFVKSLRA